MSYRVLGYSYLWAPRDGLPRLTELPGFRAGPSADAALIARLAGLSPEAAAARLADAHLAYLAWLEEAPVAYGWVATRRHGIEELDIDYLLPDRRYALWDFSTLPAWRGRGVYPRLLQAILRREAPRADWFEISHELGNDASRRGILRAGFHLSNQIVLTEEGQVRLAPTGDLGRAGESGMGQRIGMLPAAP